MEDFTREPDPTVTLDFTPNREPEGPDAYRPFEVRLHIERPGEPPAWWSWRPDLPHGGSITRIELLDAEGVPYLAVPFCRHGGGAIHSICRVGDPEEIDLIESPAP